jgi:hypothetical protein
MTRRISETCVETQLAPTLSQGVVVIFDNLPAHKSEKAAQPLLTKEEGHSTSVALLQALALLDARAQVSFAA